jgi:hypothetical protein
MITAVSTGTTVVVSGAAVLSSDFLADAARSVVSALLSVTEKVPLAGRCAAVLKDIFALYQVRCGQSLQMLSWDVWVVR